jgi:hypothetical protein
MFFSLKMEGPVKPLATAILNVNGAVSRPLRRLVSRERGQPFFVFPVIYIDCLLSTLINAAPVSPSVNHKKALTVNRCYLQDCFESS